MRLSNIALYDKNTTDFFDQGLGILSDAISSESTEEVQDNGNITYEMVLKYPIGGVLSDQLKLPNLIRAQESEDPNDFMIFEIYDYDEDDEGEMTVYAQAMPYRVLRLPFNDDSKFPTQYKNIQELMDYAVSRVTGFPSWFKITSDIIVANNLSFDAGNAQFENLGKFLDATLSLIDASVEYTWNRINILDSRGRDLSDIVLRDDKNTNGIKITGSYEKIINKVVPIIRNRNETTGEFEDGTHMGSVVTSKDPFKWIPYYAGVTATFDSQEEANNYISSNKLDNPAITVDVTPLMVDEDLTQVHTFDRITAYSTKLKYQDTLQVTTRVFDQLNAEVVSFKMGSIKKDINSTTSYTLSSLASEIARAQNIAGGAARSADGKNTNYYTEATPANPIEGDLWFHKIDGKDVIQQYINGEWSTIVKDGMGKEIRSYVDQKMLENGKALDGLNTKLKDNDEVLSGLNAKLQDNDKTLDGLNTKLQDNDEVLSGLNAKLQDNDAAMDKLHTDLASNTQIINDNKQAVDDAMRKVNKTLTQAQTDTATAVKNADLAVNASGLATQTANAASDAAIAAKNLATSTANAFDGVRSQAATAANDAADAISAANKAQGQLALKITQNDLTKRLDGYATQTWAQNQITATAQGWETQLSTIQAQYNNLQIGGRNYLLDSDRYFTGTFDQAKLTAGAKSVSSESGKLSLDQARLLLGKTIVVSIDVEWSGWIRDASFNRVGIEWELRFDDGSKFFINAWETTKTESSPLHRFHSVLNVPNGNLTSIREGGLYIASLVTATVGRAKIEIGNTPTDWSPAPEDSATYTNAKVADLKLTVDELSATFAKQTDLEKATSDFKVTADGLNLLTTATGTNGENVTQVIADVNNIQNTMTGPNGVTTRLQTLEGFQSTASNDILGLKSTQTLMASQWQSTISSQNLVYNSEMVDNFNGWNLNSNYIVEPTFAWGVEDSIQPGAVMQSDDPEHWTALKSKAIKVNPGAKYSIYAMGILSSTGATPLEFYIELRARDSNGTVLSYNTAHFDTKSKETWQEVKHENIVMPENSASVIFNIIMHGAGYVKVKRPMVVQDAVSGSYRPYSPDMSQITQLQSQIDLRTTVAGKVTAALNLSNDGGGTVTIRGASLYVTAASHFDDASIKSASIASLDATKITSGSISSDRLATTKLNADNITSGSISADRLATTDINADNIVSGSIAAERLASTQINANNITSGFISSDRLLVTKLNADNITSGSISAELLATTKLNADNITSGSIDASLITAGYLNADRIHGGTLDGYRMDIVNINATNITTGTISGSNLSINLTTGDVKFQSGRIHDRLNHVDINIDPSGLTSYLSVANGDNRVLLKGGELQFIQPQLFDLQKTPYLSISNQGSGSNWAGATFIGRDSVVVANSANTRETSISWRLGQNNFAGLMAGKNANGNWDPTIIGGANRGVVISGGTAFATVPITPFIHVGTDPTGKDNYGTRIMLYGQYVYSPSTYKHTMSGSANVIVANDGALIRTSSASKYKSDIARFRSTEMAEKLIRLPQAHWYNKEDMKRYSEDPDHYSMPEMDYGMIAEDIAGAGLEDLVSRGEDGELEDVRYDRMAAVLLPLIASMKQEIEELKGE